MTVQPFSATAPVKALAGSNTDPSITFTGNTGTGFYSPGANQVAVTTDGTQRLLIDENGAITVANKFSVPLGTKELPSIFFGTDTDTGIYSPGADQVAISTNGTGRLFVDASGRVGVGQSVWTGYGAGGVSFGIKQYSALSPQGLVIESSSDGSSLTLGHTGSVAEISAYYGSSGSYAPIAFKTSNTERARIDSSGRLLVGTSSARTDLIAGTRGGQVQIEAANSNAVTALDNSSLCLTMGSSTVFGSANIFFTRTKSNSLGGVDLVAGNDILGGLYFQGTDGTDAVPAALIKAEVDGTPAYAATALVNGQTYRIVTVGTTDFTLIGASANTVGTVFTATGPGTGTGTAILNAGNMPGRLVFSTTADGASSPTERMRIDSSGRLLVGTSTATGPAILQVQTPTTLSTTADTGVSIINTSTKTYPTTSNFIVCPGFYQDIELGNSSVVDATTPGGFNFVNGFQNQLTKSAGNTQDIERLYFNGFFQNFLWTDANTCKQYSSFDDTFVYQGFNANGRSSTAFSAATINLEPPDGTTQSISSCSSTSDLSCSPQGTSTISIANSHNISPILRIKNYDAGTKTVNITNHSFFSSRSNWGVAGSTGILNATITNLYGLRLTAPNNSTGLTVTNNWGIRQEWSSANNWFAGASNQFPNITTTASGANAFLDSADSNRLYRSTSSIVYKKDVEDLDHSLADNIHLLRPVWYRSKCEADCQDWSWFGLIAEEVAEIEPRLVHYGYQEDAYELVDVTETVELPPEDPRREHGEETEEVTKQERHLKDDAQQVPNGVAYDRLAVLLLDVVQRQEVRIKELEAKVAALETP